MSELIHGMPSTYNNHKCRCRTEDGLFTEPQTMGCTEAWAAYIRERGYVKNYQKRQREEKKTVETIKLADTLLTNS